MKTIALGEDEYFAVIQKSARAGRIGGAVFDALPIACPRKAKAETIYTWNSSSAEEQVNDNDGEDDADSTAAVVAEPGAHIVPTAAEEQRQNDENHY
jgi:hypothetical protein